MCDQFPFLETWQDQYTYWKATENSGSNIILQEPWKVSGEDFVPGIRSGEAETPSVFQGHLLSLENLTFEADDLARRRQTQEPA